MLVLERRHVVGGAAVTEEIVPGFQFSRASYLLSLLRPDIVRDLELKVGWPGPRTGGRPLCMLTRACGVAHTTTPETWPEGAHPAALVVHAAA